MSTFEEGQVLKGTVDKLAYGGDGIVRIEGFPFFLPRVAPGDQVEFRIRDVRRRYGRGIPIQLIEVSSSHAEPDCPYYEECGGCHTQHLERDLVLKTYEESIEDALRKFGPGELPLADIIQAPKIWNYRNRVTYHRQNGEQGYVRWTDYTTLDIDQCPIAAKELNTLWGFLRPQLKDINETFLPYVVLRSTSTGSLAAIFSVTGLGENQDTDNLESVITKLPQNVSAFITEVKEGSRTPFGKEVIPVRGEELLQERILDTDFYLYPEIFFQVHTAMAEVMVRKLQEWSKGKSEILDVFCGAGLFSLPLAMDDKKLLGIEMSHRSVLSAQFSAERNALAKNARFRAGKAETILERIYREGERFSSCIVDPPRKGLPQKVIDQLSELGVRDLAYVSCSPPTLARDLKILLEKGFEIESIQPLEMFPHTYHVEVMAFLKK